MKTNALGILTALLLVASAAAHAFLGWPAFRGPLAAAQVDADVVAALSIGWYFGSVSMLGFGVIVLHQALRRRAGRPVQPGPLWAIAVLYLGFGTTAFLARGLNPHFLLFAVTGLLVGLFALLAGRDAGAPA